MNVIKNYITAFKIAWSMMTAIPLFRSFEFKEGFNGKAVSLYPLIGLILGMITWGISLLANQIYPALVANSIVFVLYTLFTGGLHLDGFADTSDALSSLAPKEKAIEILKDPRIGALGAVHLILLILLKWALFISIPTQLFVIIPLLSRLSAVISINRFPYLSTGSMSVKQKSELRRGDLILGLLFMFAVVPFWGVISLIFLPLPWFFSELFGRKIESRLGGLNGDSYGYIIELSELLYLILIVTITSVI